MSGKSKKILILGNGFDLAHGLPTRYSDFLGFCERVEIIFTYPRDAKPNEYQTDYLDNWDINTRIKEKLLIAYNNRESENNDSYNPEYIIPRNINGIQEIYECLSDNIWYKYFKELHYGKRMRGENWIDFESEISFIVRYIDSISNDLSFSYEEILKRLRQKEQDHSNKLNIIYKELERAVNKTASKRDYSNLTLRDMREKLYFHLVNLTRALELYLSNFVEELPVDLLSDDINAFDADLVINFNYTNTYEKCYKKQAQVFYIHGKCNASRNIDENDMVLGIDEYLSENDRDVNTNFTIFKKFAQRIRKRTGVENYNYLKVIEKNYQDNNKVTTGHINGNLTYTDGISYVYIFGHSLDITDKDILSDFIKSDATAVTIFCRDKGTERELIANVIKLIGEKSLLQKVTQSPPKLIFSLQKKLIDNITSNR